MQLAPSPSGLRADTAPRVFDVVVLGAGVVGVSTAYALARRGLSVALVDQKPGPAMGASFANGAQLSYAYCDTLGNPGILRKLPGLALGTDPQFRLKPSLDPDFLRWTLQFLKSCTRGAQRKGTLATLALALESRLALHQLLARHALSFGHEIAGKMHLYFDQGALDDAMAMVHIKREHGAVQHVLGVAEARAMEPALETAQGLVGVIHSPGDEVGDPYRFCTELTSILETQYGVRTLFGVTARDVEFASDAVVVTTEQGDRIEGRTLVVALGASASGFLNKLGFRFPLQPLKGYSITAPPGAAAPRISLTDTSRKIVFCNLDGQVRIAGIAELGNWRTDIVPGRVAQLTQSARRSLPHAARYDAIGSSWAGLRPMSPSSVPSISSPRPGLVVNIGQGMLGWTLAMGSAERAAHLVLHDQGASRP